MVQRTKRLDYNRIANEQSLNGWSFDELLVRLTADAAQQFGSCDCTNGRACHHAAAAALDGIIRFVMHPEDCPACARLQVQDRET